MAGKVKKVSAPITKKKPALRKKLPAKKILKKISKVKAPKKASRPLVKAVRAPIKKSVSKKTQTIKKSVSGKPRKKIARASQPSLVSSETKARLYSSGDLQTAPIAPAPFFQNVNGELPAGYGDHFIYLMVRDPQWLYAYWEIQKPLESNALQQLGGSWDKVRSILRIYNAAPECSGRVFFDIELTPNAVNWFIEVEPNQSYVVEIGLRHEDGRFIALARSNGTMTPRVTMSEVLDEEWMGIDFDRMYALSGGFELGKSSEALKKLIQERFQNAVSSGSGAGWAASSGSLGGPDKKRKFWFNLDCELIVYGATEPDAAVSINGKPIKLRPDGTFTLRYSLPDGQIQVAAQAVSADQVDRRTITPVVVRKTQMSHPASHMKRQR